MEILGKGNYNIASEKEVLYLLCVWSERVCLRKRLGQRNLLQWLMRVSALVFSLWRQCWFWDRLQLWSGFNRHGHLYLSLPYIGGHGQGAQNLSYLEVGVSECLKWCLETITSTNINIVFIRIIKTLMSKMYLIEIIWVLLHHLSYSTLCPFVCITHDYYSLKCDMFVSDVQTGQNGGPWAQGYIWAPYTEMPLTTTSLWSNTKYTKM